MLLDAFEKTAAEQYTKAIDYTDRLPSGATLSSVIVTAYDLADGSDVSGSLIGAEDVSGNLVRIPVQGGTDGHQYMIVSTATLSNGNVLVDRILCKVSDRGI